MSLGRMLRSYRRPVKEMIRAFSFGVLIGLGILCAVGVMALSSPKFRNLIINPPPDAVSQTPKVTEPVVASGAVQ